MNDIPQIPRLIGSYTTGEAGPLLVITGGVHGNEPSGIIAVKKVLDVLQKEQPQIKGTVVAIAGNRSALNKNTRYIDEDLNRVWTEANVSKNRQNTCELREMAEIIKLLEEFDTGQFSKRYFLDCHTTSSDTKPYISVQEVNDNLPWAQNFPTYIIRGFSDIVEGCIDHYLSRTGYTGFVFEAGQHESEASVNHHEAMIWMCIAKACNLDLESLSCYPNCISVFSEKNNPGQAQFKICYRYGLSEGDNFKMLPGYESFQHINRGELLAYHNDKEVRSEWDAFIFMPLYQPQGNDGFFVIEQV